MNPILIVAYPDKIAAEQSWLDIQIAHFQAIYNQFNAINITVTLPEINQVRSNILHYTTNTLVLSDFVTNKMVAKTAAPTLNGVPIKPEKIKDMIDIPNSEPIRQYILNNSIPLIKGFGPQLQPELFEIVADVVRRKATTNDLITAKWSYYTQNDKGVQTFDFLDEWNNNVTAFNIRLAAAKATFRIPVFKMIETPGGLRPDVQTIRANEAKYPADYVPA